MSTPSFIQGQQQYVSGLTQRIPTLYTQDNAAIELALAGVDPKIPASFSNKPNTAPPRHFTDVSLVAKKDADCRSFMSPSNSMRADIGDRIGCGWWYVPDTPQAQGTSVGAYGSRRGPFNAAIGREYGNGNWVWDLNEARKREALKVANRVKSCPDIQLYSSSEAPLGWCPPTKQAIVLTADGRVAYPNNQSCSPDALVVNARTCPVGKGPGAGAGVCDTQPLSSACLQAVTTAAGCNASGSLFDSLHGGRPTESQVFNSVYQYVTDGGFSLNNGIITDGNVSVETALQSIKGLKGLANMSVSNSSDQAKLGVLAAKNMCYGTEFDPCNILDSKKQPYDSQCIRKLAISMGYSSNGTLLTNSAAYWNRFATWKDVKDHLSSVKQYADTGPKMDEQVDAILKVYGVSVRPNVPSCIINSIATLGLWLDAADPHGNGAAPTNDEVISTWVNKAGNQQYNAKAVTTISALNTRGGATYSSSKKGLRMNKNMYETNYPANPSTETVFIVSNTNTPTTTPYNSALISGRQGARGIWVGYTDAGGARSSPAPGTMGVLSSDVGWVGSTAVGTYKNGETTIATVQFDGRQAITDVGYSDRPRGWYDAKGDGRGPVDYGRWVGSPPWWSVALADEPSQYSENPILPTTPRRFNQPDPATLQPNIPSNASPFFPKFSLSLNGAAPISGPLNIPFAAGTTTTIGQQLGAGYIAYNFDGYAMEIIIFKSVLPQEQIQKVEGYLAWKWGLNKQLPYNHPYKSKAP